MALIFTRRADTVFRGVVLSVLAGIAITTWAVWYYFTPKYTRVGYSPEQPVPFSHEFHAGGLGIDCRFCHQAVMESPHSTVPTAETCMNCHAVVGKGNERIERLLAPVYRSYESGKSGTKDVPVPWKRIHKVPDYAYFNHSVHVNRGVSCVSCHGKVNEMKVVKQAEPQSMSWCLDCHRDPTDKIRPKLQDVLNLNWGDDLDTDSKKRDEQKLTMEKRNINPPQNCQSCHR